MKDGFLDFPIRPRRGRICPSMRTLFTETTLSPSDFVLPLFVQEGRNKKEPIPSMEGVSRYSIDEACKELERAASLGIVAANIFCYTSQEKKDAEGSEAIKKDNLLQKAIQTIKKELPHLCVMADIALDPFTSHGHDGLVDGTSIVNDPTVQALGEMALRAAEAGVDVISPSDMMDGRIGYLRKTLDRAGFCNVAILSYAAKYASALYGPFRDALDSAPSFGDKKSYQMNPANVREALRECALDVAEGADMLLIKPAISNLDIIAKVKETTTLPVGAYQVSGEYAMLRVAAKQGLINYERALLEMLLSTKRAGASFIFTYAACDAARLVRNGC